MPIDIKMSDIAEAPFLPDFGLLSQARNSHAAFCSASPALPLTTVIQE